MKAALSFVLAGLLVTTPLKLVLAQAAQQDSTTVHTTSLDNNPDAARLIHVPDVTPATAALWQPLLRSVPKGDSLLVGADLRQDGGGIRTAVTVVIVLALVVIAILLLYPTNYRVL